MGSILQFLAVCGSTQLAEAFAAEPDILGAAMPIFTESISGQGGFSNRCPCFDDQKCKFRGLAPTLEEPVNGVMWSANLNLFASWTNECWDKCYKDPDRGNGTEAQYYGLCSRGAPQWR